MSDVLVLLADPTVFAAKAEQCRALLSREERERELRFRFVRDQELYRVAHTVTRLALSRLEPRHPRDWEFETTADGKPEVNGGGPHFNLSHTHGLVACAVFTQSPVGVDVETRARTPDSEGLARRYFAASEVAWLDGLPEEERHDGFLRLWTLKEAWLKATGKGLRVPLSSVVIDPSGDPPTLELDAQQPPSGPWTLHSRAVRSTHWLAVATDCAKYPGISVEWASLDALPN